MKQEFVTLTREVVELALDAFTRGGPPDCKDGMTDFGGVHPWGEAALIECPSCQAVEALRAALYQPQVEQKPVAWLADAIRSEPTELIHKWRVLELIQDHAKQQAKRAPLTDEQIKDIVRDVTWEGLIQREYRIVRAVERAHGIGGED